MTKFHAVCDADSIPLGTGRAFVVGETIVAVFNDGGTFRAINDMCPHMGASLADGHFEEGIVTCPWHAWRFSVRTGTWCDNPVLSTDVYEARVVKGKIEVAIPT